MSTSKRETVELTLEQQIRHYREAMAHMVKLTEWEAERARVEELEHDLDLMMRSRKVLWQGLGKVLMACGNYTDCQERGGDCPLERAMQDVMNASRETWVEFNRMMDGALDDI